MKQAVKLLLIALLLMQVVAPFIVFGVLFLINLATNMASLSDGSLEALFFEKAIIPAQLLGIVFVLLYLIKRSYIPHAISTWTLRPLSAVFFSLTALLSASWLVSLLSSQIDFLPDIMQDSLAMLESNMIGLSAIALIGPIVEELLFRGAVYRLIKKYHSTGYAIAFSAFLFSIFHLNPAQMLPAFLLGILLAWVYSKTGSLLICILMHVLNNSVALYFNFKFTDATTVAEILPTNYCWWSVAIAAVVLVVSVLQIKRVDFKKR